jgi:hypothetical protein
MLVEYLVVDGGGMIWMRCLMWRYGWGWYDTLLFVFCIGYGYLMWRYGWGCYDTLLFIFYVDYG